MQWPIQDFPEVGAPTPRGKGGGRQHTILSKFPKKCMKLKEYGPRGGASKILLCRSATGIVTTVTNYLDIVMFPVIVIQSKFFLVDIYWH